MKIEQTDDIAQGIEWFNFKTLNLTETAADYKHSKYQPVVLKFTLAGISKVSSEAKYYFLWLLKVRIVQPGPSDTL